MRVYITQYKRPRGAKETVWCDGVPDELQAKVDEIHACGLRFAAEVLTTDDISLTLENNDGDFDIDVFLNEPSTPKRKLEEMIRRFDRKAFDVWAEGERSESQ